ncbi:MAG TPA: hypothetical protein VLJ16_02605 [Acidobacteriota bacterium]|nr:hypothetical protein [Acidobacteriota bacterium]
MAALRDRTDDERGEVEGREEDGELEREDKDRADDEGELSRDGARVTDDRDG